MPRVNNRKPKEGGYLVKLINDWIVRAQRQAHSGEQRAIPAHQRDQIVYCRVEEAHIHRG